MKSVMKILTLFTFVFLATAAFATPVAASDWLRLVALENVLQNSDSYNIVWDGPSRGDRLFFTTSKEKPSALEGLDIADQDFDVLTYEKTNVNSNNAYRSSGGANRFAGGYGAVGSFGFRGAGWSRPWGGFSQTATNNFRDASEQLFIDNTQNNLARHGVRQTAILTAGNVANTHILSQANVANTRTLADRDIRQSQLTETGETNRARINAQRDVDLRNADVRGIDLLANRDIQTTRFISQAGVDTTRLTETGETNRARINSNRDIGLARTTRDQTRIFADRDVDIARLQTNRDVELAEIASFTELARTDLVTTNHPRYDPRLGYYNWRY